MCDIISALAVTSAVASAASAGVGYAAQSAQASAQTAMAKANAKAAQLANNQKQAEIASDFWNKRDQIIQDQGQRDAQAAEAQARARVSAGEGGVSGLVLDSVMNDISRQRAQDSAISQKNLGLAAIDTENAQANANAEMLSRARSIPMGVAPSILSPMLQATTSSINSYFNYKQMTKA